MLQLPTVEEVRDLAAGSHLPLANLDNLEAINIGHVTYRRFLHRLCLLCGVEVAIELGVASGSTTYHLAAGVSRLVVGVDIAPDWPVLEDIQVTLADGWGYLSHARAVVIIGDSTDAETFHKVAEEVYGCGRLADLLFIDSLHQGDHARLEWEMYQRLLAPKAIVAMDDIKDPEDMWDAFQAIPGEHIDLSELHVLKQHPRLGMSPGFGVVLVEK